MSAVHSRRIHLGLLLLGACTECVYALYLVWQFPLLRYYRRDLNIGEITTYSHAHFYAFLVLFTLLFALFGLAWWLVRRLEGASTAGGYQTQETPGARETVGASSRVTLWLILGFGALFALTVTFVYPITAIDLFAYVQESRILVHYHQNPLVVAPAAFPHDPLLMRATVWRHVAAPYGPVTIMVDAVPTVLAPGNLLANLILLKLLFSGMALACAYVVYRILERIQPQYALGGALLVAWNPLVLFEVGANGHNDILMMLLALLALLAVSRDMPLAGILLLVASALAKYATLVLVPLVFAYGLWQQPTPRRRVIYAAKSAVLALTLVIVAYAPFWDGTKTLEGISVGRQGYADSFSRALVEFLPGSMNIDRAAFLGWLLFTGVYVYTLWLATDTLQELLRGCFVAMFGFVALGLTNFHVWYALWPVLLAAALPSIAENVAATLLGYGATLSAAFLAFIFVWMGDIQNPDAFPLVDKLSYVVTFVPAALALTAGYLWRPLFRAGRREPEAVP